MPALWRLSTRGAVTGVLLLVAQSTVAQQPVEHGEIASARELRQRLGLDCNARPAVRLSPARVPPELVSLIPLAQSWGISDDVIRDACQQLATAAQKRTMARALRGKTAAISRWLDSFPAEAPVTEERAAFMYLLLALDEMQLWPDGATPSASASQR